MTSRTTPTNGKSTAKTAAKPSARFSLVQAAKEREENEERPEPFTVELEGGTVVTLRDPQDLGWQEAAAMTMENPFITLQTILTDDEYEEFCKTDYKVPEMRGMLEAWREHYGVADLGN